MKSLAALLAFPLALGTGAGIYPEINLTPSQRTISKVDIQSLINEYKLIQQKKSRLSRSQRDMVEGRVQYLIEMGRINTDLTIKTTT